MWLNLDYRPMSISDQVLRIVSTCRRGCHNALNSRQIFKGRSSRILKDSFNQKCEACVEGGGDVFQDPQK